jgi:glucose-1-phosphate thymidylyltransferase
VIKALIVAGAARDDAVSTLIGTPACELMPVANRAIVLRALDSLRRAGISEIAIAAHRAIASDVRTVVGDGRSSGVRVTHILRDGPPGIGHAILAAEEFLAGSPFLVQAGHGFCMNPLRPLVERLVRRRLDGLILDAPRPAEAAGSLDQIQLFGPAICERVRQLKPSWRGELEIDEAVAVLVERGRVERETIGGWWSYDGSATKLLEGNRFTLDQVTDAGILGTIEDSEISGSVTVHPTARVRSSVIRGPVAIGAAATVADAYVGPHTSVGDRVVIEGAEIEDSVILRGAAIRHLAERLECSVVGQDAKLFRDFRLPKAHRLVVGRGAEIALA